MADPDAAGQAHNIFRVLQVLTLIPAWALMAAVVSWYNSNNIDTPGGVLTLFIVTLLASVWAFCILIAVLRAGNTALWIAFWDIIALAALIAAVATTSNIANYECSAPRVSTQAQTQTVYITSDGQRIVSNTPTTTTVNRDADDQFWSDPNNCNLIKAAWGLAIANIIMFFITAILAVVVYRNNQDRAVVVDHDYVRDRSPPVVEKVYPDYPRRPRRSHHSSRSGRPRSYVYEETTTIV